MSSSSCICVYLHENRDSHVFLVFSYKHPFSTNFSLHIGNGKLCSSDFTRHTGATVNSMESHCHSKSNNPSQFFPFFLLKGCFVSLLNFNRITKIFFLEMYVCEDLV